MISELESEISSQPGILARFLGEEIPRAPDGAIMVGAGDSLAAASIASYLSSMKHVALDPYELASNPALARRRTVYFVSVSGMTASNIAAAKAVKGIASERIAVTANPGGRLINGTDSFLFLPHKPSPRLPGTLTFSLSLLALLKLTQRTVTCDFSKAFSKAKGGYRGMRFSTRGISHFLGNGPAFPVCFYTTLKIFEILGSHAQHSQLEEFSHAGLFSLTRDDAINVVCGFDPMAVGSKLVASLAKAGFRSSAIRPPSSNEVEQVFYLVFLSQLAVAHQARVRGLVRPYFVGAKHELAVSDAMIY